MVAPFSTAAAAVDDFITMIDELVFVGRAVDDWMMSVSAFYYRVLTYTDFSIRMMEMRIASKYLLFLVKRAQPNVVHHVNFNGLR